MKKISSGGTVFHKRVFPVIWFGFLAVFLVVSFRGPLQQGEWMFLAAPIFMGVVGFVLMKKLVWDLVDEVHDCGDYLLIRRGDEQERVPLSNIMNVSASTNTNPPRITLRLLKPGKFGAEIAFTPQVRFSLNPFAKNPIVDELIVRVDKARRA